MQWPTFLDLRGDYLCALATVVADAVPRADTPWPVFHGCYDWHSAVHGLYALHATGRLTADPRWIQAAETVLLAPGALEKELVLVRKEEPPGENPYGYAWLLALAVERGRATGRHDLDTIAQAAAGHLRRWLCSMSPGQLIDAAASNRYPNASWALLNLWQWARHVGDEQTLSIASALAAQLLAADDRLPLSVDQDCTGEFFPPALSRARCLLAILPAQQAQRWLRAWIPQDHSLAPLGPSRSAHQAGLNFSRAWGLWALWSATGDEHWRTLYAAHIRAHMEQPAFWAEDYERFSHWVPQFGIYAIALSFSESQLA